MSRLLGFVDDSPPWFSHTETKKPTETPREQHNKLGDEFFHETLKLGFLKKSADDFEI